MRVEVALAVARAALAAAAPLLAWLGLERLFMVALAAALAADLALDSMPSARAVMPRARAAADLVTRAAIPLALVWLRPYLLTTEATTYWALVAAVAAPAAYAFIKYGRLPRYQARAATVALYLTGAAAIFLVATGATWPLRLAVLALAAAALEEMAITTVLPAARSPVRSLPAALRLRRELPPAR